MEEEKKFTKNSVLSLYGWSLFLALIALPFYSFAQDGNIRQSGIIKTYYDEGHTLLKEMYSVRDQVSRILEGDYTAYYLNGKIKVHGNYINNEPDGIWTYYYENGNVKMRGKMKNNRSTGLWKYYFENGETSMQGNMDKGTRTGDWKFYFESGLLKSEGPFTHGEKSGIWNYYYEDGSLKAQAFFKGDQSEYKEFYTSGNVKMKGFQHDGKSDSLWTYYYENGSQQATGYFKDGMKEGLWTFYNEKGTKTSQGEYHNGEKNGKWVYYYGNGNISSEGEVKNGDKDGIWKLFNPQGQNAGNGKYDAETGNYNEFYTSGKLKVSGKIVNDENEGKWLYYYEDGSLEGECDFTNGEGIYTGYYPSGNLKMKGRIKDGKNIGSWELYDPDGKLTGYYHPIYENDKPVFRVMEKKPAPDTVSRDNIKPEYYYKNRKNRYFTPVINEYRGFIIATNPFGTIIGKLPLSLEYYCQERLGHEIQVNLIRQPFFGSHVSIDPNTLYSNGFDIAFRQKLYSKDHGFGMFYIANELRYTYIEHSFNALDSTELPVITTRKIQSYEQLYEYSFMIGNRWMQLFGDWMIREKKQNGITLDVFVGMGIGYRKFTKKYDPNPDYDKVFDDVHQGKLSLSPRFGINLGYVF